MGEYGSRRVEQGGETRQGDARADQPPRGGKYALLKSVDWELALGNCARPSVKEEGRPVETQERPAMVRLLNDNDYDGLLKIQRENVDGSVPAGARSGGFLSSEFTVEQLRTLHESAGIVVATVGDSLAAFFCLSTLEANQDAPIVMAMRESMRS